MKRFKNLTPFIPLTFFGMLIVMASCGKKDPAKAEITVVDEAGNRIEDATVYLLCTPVTENKCVVNDTQTTNSSGKTEHTFDHPAIYNSDDVGFAVLRVEVFKDFDSSYTYQKMDTTTNELVTFTVDTFYRMGGEAYIELQVDKVTKETVTIIRE